MSNLYNHLHFALLEIDDAVYDLEDSLKHPRDSDFQENIRSIIDSLDRVSNRLFNIKSRYDEKQEKSHQKQ